MLDSTKNLYYLMLTVPLLYLFMAVEGWIAVKKMGKKRTMQGVTQNITISMGQQVFGAFIQVGIVLVYSWVYQKFHFFALPNSVSTVLLAFLILDFNTYWFHRLGHRTQVLWANHSVHHSSNEFGLSAGVRHPWFSAALLSIPGYSLALIGISPQIFFPLITAFYLYQYFTHSDIVPKLGWIEKVLVTPSHHRVHHAKDDQYIDCNYGAALIIWDRLFGTFVEEKEEPTYGLVQPTGIQSAVWENLYPYYFLWQGLKLFPTFREKWAFLIRPPGQIFSSEVEVELAKIKSEIKLKDRRFQLSLLSKGSFFHWITFVTAYILTVAYMGAHHVVRWQYSLTMGLSILALVLLQPAWKREAEYS